MKQWNHYLEKTKNKQTISKLKKKVKKCYIKEKTLPLNAINENLANGFILGIISNYFSSSQQIPKQQINKMITPNNLK